MADIPGAVRARKKIVAEELAERICAALGIVGVRSAVSKL